MNRDVLPNELPKYSHMGGAAQAAGAEDDAETNASVIVERARGVRHVGATSLNPVTGRR